MNREIVNFQFQIGTTVNPQSGFFEKGHPEWMCDFHFYQVATGDEIICMDERYQYYVASYSSEIEDRLIYTYCYQEEENWSSYRGDFNPEIPESNKYLVEEDGYVRVAVKRITGEVLDEADVDKVWASLVLNRQVKSYQRKDYYDKEIEQTVRNVLEKKDGQTLIFGLITDSHYVINGGWEDTLSNLRAVHEQVPFDAVVHLGDLTDGMIPLSVTKEYVSLVMQDLNSLQVPVYLALGNHDSNYFNKNPEWMTQEEQSDYYLSQKKPWYYVDFGTQKLRCIFLHSFNHKEKIRYGFPQEEVEWVKETLEATPEDFSVLIFSHVPLLPEMHFWTKEIRNSSELLRVLEEYVCRGGVILGYIHGHNHADQINTEKSFPIVSVGCAKCEDFKDKKPEGSVTYDRKMGTVTQELWDVMMVDVLNKKIDFVRFGAGEDRRIVNGRIDTGTA